MAIIDSLKWSETPIAVRFITTANQTRQNNSGGRFRKLNWNTLNSSKSGICVINKVDINGQNEGMW